LREQIDNEEKAKQTLSFLVKDHEAKEGTLKEKVGREEAMLSQ